MSDVPAEYAPPPPPPPPPPPASSGQFEFGRPFEFVFKDPQWLQKILIGGLFYLASFLIIGAFFVLGYCAALARNVMRGKDVPLPEWNDLGGYFAEGARLIGVSLVYMLPFFALLGFIIVPAILAEASGGNRALEALTAGFMGCITLLFIPLMFAVIVFMPASMLFAIAEERFGAAFEFRRIWQFIRENLGNYLLAVVIYIISGFIGELGFLLLCIGVIFTGFWSMLITFHAFAQVYRYAPRRP
jgi:Protein of unknown function (DUF4013)